MNNKKEGEYYSKMVRRFRNAAACVLYDGQG